MREAKPRPPRHLHPETRRWFKQVAENFELEPHHLHLLTLACEARDRAEAARDTLARLGVTYQDRFGQPRARPEVAIERDSRIGFSRLLRELGLDGAADPGESRPPGLRSGRTR